MAQSYIKKQGNCIAFIIFWSKTKHDKKTAVLQKHFDFFLKDFEEDPEPKTFIKQLESGAKEIFEYKIISNISNEIITFLNEISLFDYRTQCIFDI